MAAAKLVLTIAFFFMDTAVILRKMLLSKKKIVNIFLVKLNPPATFAGNQTWPMFEMKAHS